MVRERKCRASSKATEELVAQIAEPGGFMAGQHNQKRRHCNGQS